MGDRLDHWSWPVRRYLADRLVGEHAYSRNVCEPGWSWADYSFGNVSNSSNLASDSGWRFDVYDREAS